MKRWSHLSIKRGMAYLLILTLCVNCKKEINTTDPLQPAPGPVSPAGDVNALTSGAIQSQTRTANLFNCYGEAFLDLWYQGGTGYLSGDDGSYAYSKKLSPGRGTLQLQLHDFRFEIPAGATIQNITVNAKRFKTGSGSIRDYFAYLIKKDDLRPTLFRAYGVRWTNPEYYPKVETTANYFQNGSGDNGMFGNYTWTAGMINDLNFGVRINTYEPVGSSVVVYYDMVSITVQFFIP